MHARASSLRGDITGSRNIEPRQDQQPSARLDTLILPLQARVASFLAVGGTDAATLGTVSKKLRSQWRERALADKLVAALETELPQPVTHEAFKALIDNAAALPSPLCYEVFRRVPDRLCNGLDASGDNMERVIEELTAKLPKTLAVEHQFMMLDNISAAFQNPNFRAHFSNPHSRKIDRQAMEKIFARFCHQQVEFFRYKSRALGLLTAMKGAKKNAVPSGVSMASYLINISAWSVTPASRGLYMVSDKMSRANIWHAMLRNIVHAAPRVRADLLQTLIEAVACLKTQQQREHASEKILQHIGELPAQFQAAPIALAIRRLSILVSAASSEDMFERLATIANAAPLVHRGKLINIIAQAIATRQQPVRPAIFAGVLAQVGDLPLLQQQLVLETLASAVNAHPLEHQCTQAYNAVLGAIRLLPEPFQAVPAAALFASFAEMQIGAELDIRFIEAFEFVRRLPVDERAPMLRLLTSVIWRHSTKSSQFGGIDELLSLMRSQPVAERVRCVTSLYRISLDGTNEAFRFSILRKLFREVQQLPAAAQVPLIAEAAVKAARCGQPHMRFLLDAVLHQAGTLSPSEAGDVGQQMSLAFKAEVLCLNYYGAIPESFAALLTTADLLPDDLRISLLADLQASLTRCPEENRAAASHAIRDKINFLPIGLLQRFLLLKQQANVPTSASQV